MKIWRTFGSLLILLQFAPVGLLAQGQMLLRYDPPPDVPVHVLFQTVTRMETSEGRVIETADLGSMCSIALELEDGGTVVHMTYDSVRARVRSGGNDWREFPVLGADSVWLQVKVDDLMNISAVTEGAPVPAVTGLLDILTGISDLTLPEKPMSIGDVWMVDSRLPARITATVPRSVGRIPSMTFSTQISFDSVVQRTQDTLGYFSVTGDIMPSSAADLRALGAEGLAISSELDGQLIWSSGWHRWVSGANRVTMTISKANGTLAPTIERTEPELTMSVTTRFSARP